MDLVTYYSKFDIEDIHTDYKDFLSNKKIEKLTQVRDELKSLNLTDEQLNIYNILIEITEDFILFKTMKLF